MRGACESNIKGAVNSAVSPRDSTLHLRISYPFVTSLKNMHYRYTLVHYIIMTIKINNCIYMTNLNGCIRACNFFSK